MGGKALDRMEVQYRCDVGSFDVTTTGFGHAWVLHVKLWTVGPHLPVNVCKIDIACVPAWDRAVAKQAWHSDHPGRFSHMTLIYAGSEARVARL